MRRAAGKARARRARITAPAAAVIFLLLSLLIVVGLRTKPWANAAMEVTITVTAEGEKPVEVYRKDASLGGADERQRVLESEIDLGRWEGGLLRLEVSGKVPESAPPSLQRCRIACAAELVGQEGAEPLEFVGWENDGSSPLHFGRIGCPTLIAPGGSNPPFVFSEGGSLWHVLRAPARARLRVALKPVLVEEAEEAKPFIPVVGSRPSRGSQSQEAEAERPPDVFIFLVDTLRADHMSCYGYPRNTSPRIDRFATEATFYEQAQTASTWTRPSVATLLTGLYPFVHGGMRMHAAKMHEWPVFLPEILRDQGYATYGVITNITVSKKFGFDQGYDGFQYKYRGSVHWVNERVAEHLAQHPADQPVFVYAHIMEPHLPYAPKYESRKLFDRGMKSRLDGSKKSIESVGRSRPKVSAEDIEHLIDLYDAEIHDADRGFAEFLKLLRRAGRLSDALIVFVADHGEAFNEHRTLGHSRTLNQEELHVPLIIRYPKGRFRGVRVSQRVSLMDVLPTVLEVVGIKPELDYPLLGRSLVPSNLDPDAGSLRCIHSEVSKRSDNRLDLVGIIDEDGYKRVFDTSRPKGRRATKEAIGLWNTEEDVGEKADLSSTNPVRAAYDEQLIARWLQEQDYWRNLFGSEPAPPVELTDEMREELRALGYLD